MPDYVHNSNISGTSQLYYCKEYQVPGIKKENRQGKKLTKIIMKNGTKTNIMRSGSRPSPEWTRLLFAGGTVSPMMCPADGQQKEDKGQTEDKPR